MRILFFGDLQVNHKNSLYQSFLDGTMRHLREFININNPDLLINLGDLMETKSVVEVEDLVWAWNWTKTLEDMCPPPSENGHSSYWIIKGNHDISDRNCHTASVQVMEGLNTSVFMKEHVVKLEEFDVVILPYTENYSLLNKFLDSIEDKNRVRLIVGHVCWIGARMTPYFVTDKGLDPVKVLRQFPNARVFNGHYHHPVDVCNRLHMVGSPLHKDFNDIIGDIPRGFVLWDSDLDTITRIKNPSTYHCLSLEFNSEENMRDIYEKLYEDKELLKLRIYVPKNLIEEANELFKGFLWKSVVQSSSDVISVYNGSGLKIQSTPKEIIEIAVTNSPDGYDKNLLEKIGKEAFA